MNQAGQKIKLAIIGSGPAGYAAGIYAARAQLAPHLFAGEESGGQLMWTTEVENYPGFKDGIMGPELMMQMRAQAEKFGTTFHQQYITAVDFSARPFKLWTTAPDGTPAQMVVKAKPEDYPALAEKIKEQPADWLAEAVIISTGAVSIMLNVPGEAEFLGKGVSTCAVCDAAFYKDKTTFVVGGGDAALEDALALTKFAQSVTIVHRRDQLRASKIMQERVLNHPKIKMLWNSQIKEIKGEQMVKELVIETEGESQTFAADGIFIAIGHRPLSTVFANQLELDSHNYIVTRQSLSKPGLELAAQHLNNSLLASPTTTSVEGVFAAGDVVDVRYKQAITAAGQGCQAALDAERWLETI